MLVGKRMSQKGKGGGASTVAPINVSGRLIGQTTTGTPNSSGPKTTAGKRRSRQNSTRHGILAVELFLLDGECPQEYESLRQGLFQYFLPEGTMEEVLVDKLASLIWRDRRTTYAETAETSKMTEAELLRYKQQQAFPPHAQKIASVSNGLLGNANSHFLENAIQLLTDLRQGFEKRGFNKEEDLEILHKIYGFFVLTEGFPALYISQATLAGDPDDCKNRSVQPNQIRQQVIKAIADEIKRLSRLMGSIDASESQLHDHTLGTMVIPPPDVREHLMRYETHLTRLLVRILDQLERLQCHRRGQPIPPTIKVSCA
jgi:hypothetical protein